MWQPPGGISDPPELDAEHETSHRRPSLPTSHSSVEHLNNQGLRRAGSEHLNRQTNNSYNSHTKKRRCSDQPSKQSYRMANLYDIRYSSSNLLNSMPNEVMSSDEDISHRLLPKRQYQDSGSNQPNNVPDNENLTMWPLKDRFSNCSDHFNVISSFSRSRLLTAGISECTSSNSNTESGIPDLFNTDSNNTTSISEYSTAIDNNTISCTNPSTSIDSFSLSEPVSGTSDAFANSDSSSSDTSNVNSSSTGLHDSERSFSRRLSSGNQQEIVLFAVRDLQGSSIFNLPPSTVQARRVANRVIMYTRIYKTPDERGIWCLNCDCIPTLPITGQCGHTRCSKCVKENESCPCGSPGPRSPCVNTVIQAIIDKMLQRAYGTSIIANSAVPTNETYHRKYITSASTSFKAAARRATHCTQRLRPANGLLFTKRRVATAETSEGRLPMTAQDRWKRARELLSCKQFRAAAPHLARVAASGAPPARLARSFLAQAIAALSRTGDPRRLTRDLFRAVRLQSAVSWLKPADLECVLCYHPYTNPVTTPCGHTYCRTCIERSLDYRKTCALCLRSLDDFNLAMTQDTEFVCAALTAIDAVSSPSPPDPDVIPIFVCTVAFPSIPCPLFIFDPRYWLMIRRILESGSRKFGMVAYERDRSYSDYGTVLEVCDCVHLEDGRSILSTVGVSRFRVIERDVHDGCDVARIQPLLDASPSEDMIWELRMMATQISYKALLWLETMNRAVRAEIEAAFGPVPHFHTDEDWWDRTDGPQWLWWLIAILPLRSEIKILILSTRSLLKRMMAVNRTLEVMDSVAFTNNSNTECDLGTALSSTEDWLERNA